MNANNNTNNNPNPNPNNNPNPNPKENDNNENIDENNPQNIRIPKENKKDFDSAAVTILSQGCSSTVNLVRYLRRFKKIHLGLEHEVRFFDIALIAGGVVRYIYISQIPSYDSFYVKGVTTLEMQRAFCINHPVIVL